MSFSTSLLVKDECPMKERAKKLVKVMTPIPPIWIRNMMMICPVCVKVVATSTVVSPVTQTEVVEMNRAYEMNPVYCGVWQHQQSRTDKNDKHEAQQEQEGRLDMALQQCECLT